MSAKRFWAQGRGKNRENIDKKGKGWKNTMFEGRACDENTSVDITNTKNSYFCEANALSRQKGWLLICLYPVPWQ